MPINFSHPSVWGPLVWNVLHLLSSQFKASSEQDKQEWLNVLNSLPGILPCKECKEHFRAYLKENPVSLDTVSDAHSLSLYLWRAHEHVNALTGKKSRVTFAMLCKQLNVVQPTASPASVQTENDVKSNKVPSLAKSDKTKEDIQEATISSGTSNIRINVQPGQNYVGSGKPSVRILKTNPVLTEKMVNLEPAPAQPQPQPPPKPTRVPPKAVPLATQKIIIAQRSLVKQFEQQQQQQVNNHHARLQHLQHTNPIVTAMIPNKKVISIPAPSQPVKQLNTQTAIVPIAKAQQTIQAMMNTQITPVKPKSLTTIMNNARKPKTNVPLANHNQQPKPKPKTTPISKGKDNHAPAPTLKVNLRFTAPPASVQQKQSIHKMAELLQKSGIKIRGIVPTPTTYQPGIKPIPSSSMNRIMNRSVPVPRALALPSSTTVPRSLNASVPTRKKCNCGRK